MDCLSTKTIVIFLVVFYYVATWLAKALKKLNQGETYSPAGEELEDLEELGRQFELESAEISATPDVAEPSPEQDPLQQLRDEYMAHSRRVGERASQTLATFVHDPPLRPFLETLRDYVPDQLQTAEHELRSADIDEIESGAGRVQSADFVLDIVEYLARQRRDPRLIPMLGDADRLAEACYRPMLTFARAQGIPVTSNHPVTVLGDYDLSIWTGFIPTSVAPIFLPIDFFERASWWPAVAHEIGHDFFASIGGLSAALRKELGLVSEGEGTQIIAVHGRTVSGHHIERLFGAWLEELFCDVFATLMTGPAYLASMLDLFADPQDPRTVLMVEIESDESPRYGLHPPRHLRFVTCCQILGMLGFKSAADELRAEWESMHTIDDEPPDVIWVGTAHGYLALPIEPFEKIAFALAERLYRGPLEILRGTGLSGVAGLDYGPHRHNESRRARDAFLSNKLPEVRDPRAIVAGAALAAHAKPDQEGSILRLARDAIPALGTRESFHDAYHLDAARPSASWLGQSELLVDLSPAAIREAVILHAALHRYQPGPHSHRRA